MVTCALMDIRTQSLGPLKTSSHLAVHIHVSPILTRLCCGRTSEVVPILPFTVPLPRREGRREKGAITTTQWETGGRTPTHCSAPWAAEEGRRGGGEGTVGSGPQIILILIYIYIYIYLFIYTCTHMYIYLIGHFLSLLFASDWRCPSMIWFAVIGIHQRI